MGLKLYNKKRDFTKTKEPAGKEKSTKKHRFVIQEHHATRLHYDFRLEWKGVMKSWAVPKGPSLNPEDKRLAMMVEDHPIDYMYFQGAIPLGEYGGGEVRTWDIGTYETTGNLDLGEQLRADKLTFILHGKKLKGEFHMIHMHGREENAWLIFKTKDKYADPKWEIERILDYGSRVESPAALKEKAKDSVLKKLVDKSKAAAKSTPTTWKIAAKKPASKAAPKRATAAKRRTTAKKVTAKSKLATKRTVAKKRAARTK